MADMISIPSEIKFKEMLSHTFPGFFLASSIFMLIDYLSPDNLTAWAIGSLTNLVTFAGFIIIIGTILGVIIDGIHHTFIEDDIFDNFKTIHQLKQPIKEQLKANCPSYSENLSRHFFFSKIGSKGSDAIALENHLDEAYYRYSEFYSNIFISLIIFSIISPFYIFEVLELPWRTSVLLGIASLLTACFCLGSSYTSYKTYLQAQYSAICGFIKDPNSTCGLNCQEKETNYIENKELIEWEICVSISIFIVLGILSVFTLESTLRIIIGFFFIALVIEAFAACEISKYIYQEKDKKRQGYLILLSDIKVKLNEAIDQIKSLLQSGEKANSIGNEEAKIKTNLQKLTEKIQIEKIKKDLEEITKEYKITEASELREDIKKIMEYIKKQDTNKSDSESEMKLQNYLKDLKKKLEEAEKLIETRVEKPVSFKDKLSKSSPSALFSVLLNIFVALAILLFFVGAPINLHVETTSIKFSENISNETKFKNPVETLSFKNKGGELNNVNLIINGIASNWIKFSYINDSRVIENNSTIDNIASGETKFVQIRLNSSAMDTKNISQGSYIGSIDVKYSERLKSIPLIINLTK
jgi:hypothetical protein